MHSFCPGYMCILQYVKLISYIAFPYIYAGLEEGMVSVCHWYISFFYMSNLFVVVVLLRSMPDWRRGWSQSAIGICAFLYM